MKGVVLTNFMSYENAYVPLGPGLNLICGQNGAGKSSIVLAISVVLGQTYTERSKRLSDLVRWNTDEARITLILDNAHERTFPKFHTESVTITRVLKRDGAYYYLLQDKPAAKSTITDILKTIGLNPDNFLVIMHQFMVGRFAAVSAQDKLSMLEEAVGFQSYREEVLDARKRLESVTSEEQSLAKLLESTKETHDYWKREYERLLQKKQLEGKLELLRQELLWARIHKRKEVLARLQSRIETKTRSIESFGNNIKELAIPKEKRQEEFEDLKPDRTKLQEIRLELVKEITTHEVNLQWARNLLQDFQSLETEQGVVRQLEVQLLRRLGVSWTQTADESQRKLSGLKERMTELSEKISETNSRLEDALSRIIETSVQQEVLSIKRNLLMEEVADLQAQVRLTSVELEPLVTSAEKAGPPVESPRRTLDVMLDITNLESQLKPLATLSDDIEGMYSSYAKVYDDLRQKAEQVARSRQEVSNELDKRLSRWQEILSNFLEELTSKYNEILRKVGAVGDIRLISSRDIEKYGLEVLAGFKGNKPIALDAFTQSGGERSIAIIAFFLALQQDITSPFRAIDEFDVHMDPMSREVVTELIVSTAQSMRPSQYVAVTPGEVNVTDNSHVLVVQNIDGASIVSELKNDHTLGSNPTLSAAP